MQIKQNRIQNKCKVIACRLDLINVSCVNVSALLEQHFNTNSRQVNKKPLNTHIRFFLKGKLRY